MNGTAPAPAGADAPPPKRRRPAARLLRALGWLLLGLVLVLALVLSTLWWWSGREGSLATTLSWISRQPQAGLQVEQATGSLRQGGRVENLTWQQADGGLRLQGRQVALAWDLPSLLRSAWSGQPVLHLKTLKAELLRFEPRPSTDQSAPPHDLRLPMTVRVDDIQVQRLQWAGQTEVEASDIAGAYRYEGERHVVELRQARLAQGRYQGRATLAATGDMQLDAELRGQLQSPLPGSRQVLSLDLQAQARGPLQQLDLQARLGQQAPATGGNAATTQAQLQARVAPWQEPMLSHAQARFEQLNLAALWPQAPATRLSGQARIEPAGSAWNFSTQWRNAAPGPWDQGSLPVDQLSAQGRWQSGALLIETLTAQVGPGQVQARGDWIGGTGTPAAATWRVNARFDRLRPDLIDSRLPAQTLQGQAQAEQATGRDGQALRFDVQLTGASGQRRDALSAWNLLEAQAQGQWAAGLLQISRLHLRSSDAQVQASGQYRPQTRSGQGQGRLTAPGLQLQARSAWPVTQGAGELDLEASNAQAALRWLRGLPRLPQALAQSLAEVKAQGQASLRLAWTAGLPDATVQARIDLPVLDWPQASGEVLALRGLQASASGRLSQMQLQGQAQLDRPPRRLAAQWQGEVSLPPGALAGALQSGPGSLSWQATLAQLQLALDDPASGAWKVANTRPVQLRGGPGRIEVEPGQLQLLAPPRAGPAPALVEWQLLRWQQGQLQTTGQVRGLPLGWAELLAGPVLARAGMVGDLVFDGRWDVQAGQDLRISAELQRRSGDLSLHAETAQGLAARVAAGVREARLTLSSDGDRLALGWRWDSERAGQTEGQLRTRLVRTTDGWQWPENAPLSGQVQARLPRLGVWSALAPPGWRLRGSLLTELTVSGTRAQPLLNGQVQADDLALRSVVDGIELGRGRLRAVLEGERLRIDEFSLQGPGAGGGSVVARGSANWAQGQPQVNVQAQLNRLRASVRSDRLLTVSGELQAALRGAPSRTPAEITGALRVDQARIRLPDEGRPQLDPDVLVRRPGQPPAPAGVTPTLGRADGTGPLNLALRLDLGEDFRIEGKGLNTRLRGSLAVTGQSFAAPRLFGTINTADGEYRAYGQRLDIERGLLRFTGAYDNPTLDILAVRPNLTQRVGVQVTGTALLPRVRLYAEPELPEAEKLAWLVLGRSGAEGGAEAAVLQQAALALLGNRRATDRGSLASTLGLDELSFKGSSSQADGSSTGGAITFGKRLSSNFYAAYESSLSGALGTLYLFYELSQRFTVRAQTGAQTAVDLIFTVPYD